MGPAISLGLIRITADTVRSFAFLRRELGDIGTMVNPGKTIALPPKGYVPTAEISLLESVDVRIAGEGGATVVGVPIGTDEYVLDRAMEVVRDGGADHLARCLASMPDKQSVVLIAIESLGKRASYLERALDTGLPLEACKRAEDKLPGKGSGHWATPRSMQKGRQRPSTPFHRSGRVRAAVDGSEANVCLHWKQGGDLTGGCSGPHGPVRRPSEDEAP